MMEVLREHGAGLFLLVVLLALLWLRAPVVARGRLTIKAPIDHVFGLIDLRDGGEQHWQRARVLMTLVDPAERIYRMRYSVMAGGGERTSQADFRVAERVAPTRLVLERSGIAGKSERNELLRIIADLSPVEGGTRLALACHWGLRSLISQLLARADLYGSLFRIKTLAETGTASSRGEDWLAAGIAAATGLLTLAGFGLWFGWLTAALILIALIIHEFGHLLAFRLVGQPWGRLVFLPFLGGLAMPRLPFRSEGQHAFAALMGPGFSIIALLPAILSSAMGLLAPHWLFQLAGVVAILNLFNLVPVEPLDGGVALRAAFSRVFGSRVHLAMMASSALIGIAGIFFASPVIAVLGFLAAFANLKPRQTQGPSAPLSGIELAQVFGGFAVVGAFHLAGLAVFFQGR
jgi:Zn-dependent protease